MPRDRRSEGESHRQSQEKSKGGGEREINKSVAVTDSYIWELRSDSY